MFVVNVLKVALGLGFVIFLHELGHFLLAKWNGVKVEKFSIGFGPTLASWRRGVGLRIGTGSRPPGPGDPPSWGETEYILAALPLGGYVKMLGENLEEATEEKKTSDPRAFHNKSVWARMQIITAGVIMNVLLGVACFTFYYTQGYLDRPAKVGGVLPGSPAYRAGLRAGDEIVAIDDRRDVGVKDVMNRVSLSGAGEKVRFTIRRPGLDSEQTLAIEPLRDESGVMPTIGIYFASSLELFPKSPFQTPPGEPIDPAKPDGGFKGEDKVVAVGPEGGPLEPVADHDAYLRKVEPLRNQAIVIEVESKGTEQGTKTPTLRKVTVPPHHFVDFGLRLSAGPIVAIRPDSPAAKAGLKEGDRIEQVGDKADFDPMGLPDYFRDHAGQPIPLVLVRDEGGKPTKLDLKVTPDDSPAWVDPAEAVSRLVPLDVPGLGLALPVGPKIEAVAEGSPAAKAGLKPGDTLRSLVITPAKDGKEKSGPKPITIKLDGKVPGWPTAFAALQEIPWTSLELTTDKTDKPIAIRPELDLNRFHPSRGLGFMPLIREMPPLGLAESLRRGVEETIENVFSIFRIFNGLAQGRVGGDALGGVIPIAQIAYSSASTGWTPFIHFLGILSVNLAVLNFLPIPPLDGGQFCFLAAEKARGRPLPEAALNFVTIAGVVFVLGLIVIINGKDIFRLVQSFF